MTADDIKDFREFKICISTFMDWYVSNCDTIREMSEVWIESEEDTLLSILSCGLTELKTQTEIVKEADRLK